MPRTTMKTETARTSSPHPERPRQTGLALSFSATTLLLAAHFQHWHLLVQLVLLAIAISLFFLALFSPQRLGKLTRAADVLVLRFVALTNNAIILFVFFLFLTPVGLFMRIFKRDPLLLSRKNPVEWRTPSPRSIDALFFRTQY